MKRTVHDCDRCGVKDITPVVVRVATCPDYAEAVELCDACAAWALSYVSEQLSHDSAIVFVLAVKDHRGEQPTPPPEPDPPGGRTPWRFSM